MLRAARSVPKFTPGGWNMWFVVSVDIEPSIALDT
jgi:hypothetical protein